MAGFKVYSCSVSEAMYKYMDEWFYLANLLIHGLFIYNAVIHANLVINY